MKTLRLLGLAVMIALACGEDPGGPTPASPIVKLVVSDSAPGFWRGNNLALSTIGVRAVNADGDTVPAPALTWSVPAGFTRSGDDLLATREARGTLGVSTTLPAVPAINLSVSALDDLSSRGWEMEYRCYNSAVVARGVENPPIGQDSIIREYDSGLLAYTNGDWNDLRATIATARRTIRFWKDKVVDTTRSTINVALIQDTANAKVYIPNVENLRMESDTPRAYRARWDAGHTTWCEAAYIGGGSDFVLSEP